VPEANASMMNLHLDAIHSTYGRSNLNYENWCKATAGCPEVRGLALIETSGSN
jgi:hypothetical protein